MSQSHVVAPMTYKAAGDLSLKQYHGVIVSAEYTVNTAGANGVPFGGQARSNGPIPPTQIPLVTSRRRIKIQQDTGL